MTRAWACVLVVVALCVLAAPAVAAPGDLDPTFSDDGKATFGESYDDLVGFADLALDPDGTIVAAGSIGVERINSDGTENDYLSEYAGFPYDSTLRSVLVEPSEKILVATGSDFAVSRLNPDGSLDSGFGDAGIASADFGPVANGVRALARQDDGKIVAVGYSPQLSDEADGDDFAIARFKPDGTLDESFSGDGLQTTDFAADGASDVAIQSDGRIVVAGTARHYVGNGRYSGDFALARYEQDGSLDTSFSGDGKATARFGNASAAGSAVALDDQGRVVVVGQADDAFAVARFTADGALDPGFSDDGEVTTDFPEKYSYYNYPDGAEDLTILSDGSILTAGAVEADFALVRYTADGDLDTGFSGDGAVITEFRGYDGAQALVVQPDGRILAAGTSYGCNRYSDCNVYGALARYLMEPGPADTDADGVLDADDKCPNLYKPDGVHGCPVYPRTATLSYRRTSHSFLVRDGCSGQVAKVFAVQPGADDLVGSATADVYGRAIVHAAGAHGRFYARLKKLVNPDYGICTGATSDVIRVP
jgi:uncharacterized delta-60 repeat protein